MKMFNCGELSLNVQLKESISPPPYSPATEIRHILAIGEVSTLEPGCQAPMLVGKTAAS